VNNTVSNSFLSRRISSTYPFLAGHEGVGKVTAVGANVRGVKVGDRVGISWLRDSCRTCDNCMVGKETMCEQGYQGTYLGANAGPNGDDPRNYNECGGCFSRVQRVEEKFAVKIPDGIPDPLACTLLCGGATMFEPLCEFAKPGNRVGIVGVGGLGTAGIKLGNLRGSTMTALSTSERKRQGAQDAGAKNFVVLTDESAMKKVANSLDVIIDTTPVNKGIGHLMELLRPNGTLVRVGIAPGNDAEFTYSMIPFIFQQKRFAGSCVAGTKRMKEMMELVADKVEMMKDSDASKAELVGMDQLNESMAKLLKGENKGYRYVMEW
jgi:D-arabinose 1-dehydrogenase-like Zn-dependent alcohol dehydrogenase